MTGLYPFLNAVSEDDLRAFIRRADGIPPDAGLESLDRLRLYSILFAVYGFDLLESVPVRQLLTQSLSDDRLRSVAARLDIPVDAKRFDLALQIAGNNWRTGGLLPAIIADEFDIAAEYLPRVRAGEPPVEMVEPFVAPPPLFDYQEELATSLQTFLANDENELACLVQLPTGAGKTRVAMEAIARHLNATRGEQRKIGMAWLAHSEELCDQAVESFFRVWVAQGTFEVKLVRFWGSYHAPIQEMGSAFVVASYQKMAQLRQKSPDDFALFVRSLDLLVVDEAHRALAPTIKQLITALKNSHVKVVGLTATPGRGQDALSENRQLATLFEHRLLRASGLGMNPIEKLHHRGILARVRREVIRSGVETRASGQGSDNAEFADDVPVRLLAKLATDARRNELLIDTVESHTKLGHPTLVFCCTVKHAKAMAIQAAARGVRSAFLDCEMARARRGRIVASFREGSIDALFNYGVLSTGFDAPRIRCVVIARPTSSIVLYSQMIGRGLRGRAVGGSDEFTLVDVHDNIENFGGIGEVYRHFEEYWA